MASDGPRWTADQLAAFRDREVADLVGDEPKLVFVGINPGLWTAATGTHFAHPTNRFYPALFRAGITSRQFDRIAGLNERDRRELLDSGIALTNLVARATARASELTRDELRAGACQLATRIESWAPQVVAIAGVTAFRTAFGRAQAKLGRQPDGLSGAQLWVVPNPSGLNAHETVDTLADWYRQVAQAAGVIA